MFGRRGTLRVFYKTFMKYEILIAQTDRLTTSRKEEIRPAW